MSLPTPDAPIWSEIISGKKNIAFDFLAVKIFLGSAAQRYKQNPQSATTLAQELYALFEKNQKLPSAIKDIEKLK